jgi:hypothetical protein
MYMEREKKILVQKIEYLVHAFETGGGGLIFC